MIHFYNWNRYYRPRLGRYISIDPIGIDGGGNTYGYVGGSPLSNSDPMGLAPLEWDGQGDTSVCFYYDDMAKRNPSCNCYKTAATICRGARPDVNALVNIGLRYSWLTGETQNSQSAVLNTIRNALISEDKAARNKGAIDGQGCTCGNDIDRYRNTAFDTGGLPGWAYGDNWIDQGVWPNPVPYDQRNGAWSPGNWGK